MTSNPFHDLTLNVEQRLLGMKFSKQQTDYDLGYNDAVDDALRAFTEAMRLSRSIYWSRMAERRHDGRGQTRVA